MFFGKALRWSWLALIPLLAGGSKAQRMAPAFQTFAQLVLVPVTVTDRKAKTVQGLHKEDFAVFDNQVSQKIVSFGMDDAPCSVAIVLDISGSMQKSLAAAREMLHDFLKTANPKDEFLLMTVSTEPAMAPRFTRDVAVLQKDIDATRSGGLTSLLDTIHFGLGRMKSARWPRRALLILSDGIDNHSRYSQSELMNIALEADVQVYTMIFDTAMGAAAADNVLFRPGLASKPWDTARARQGPELLEKLSDKTGGLYFHIHSADEETDAVRKTAEALRNEYLIGYRPSDTALAGKWHQIRVKTKVPKVYVRARNGYYAP